MLVCDFLQECKEITPQRICCIYFLPEKCKQGKMSIVSPFFSFSDWLALFCYTQQILFFQNKLWYPCTNFLFSIGVQTVHFTVKTFFSQFAGMYCSIVLNPNREGGHPNSTYIQKQQKIRPPPPPPLYTIVCIWLDPPPPAAPTPPPPHPPPSFLFYAYVLSIYF